MLCWEVVCWNRLFFQGSRFVPYTFSETKPQMVPTDLNIGFQGLALIQRQNYNPVLVMLPNTTEFVNFTVVEVGSFRKESG